MLTFITGLGDSAVVLPASVLLLAYMLYLRHGRHAWLWFSTLALCAMLTLLLKALFFAFGSEVPTLAIRSPSGHTSLSVTFYGCCALMMAEGTHPARAVLLLAIAGGIATAVAMSRVLLHLHTWSEVLVGLAVGVICVGWFSIKLHTLPPLLLSLPATSVVFGALLIATQGLHWEFEQVAGNFASLLRSALSGCP